MPAGLLMLTGEVTPFTFEDAKSVDFDFYQREIAEIRSKFAHLLKRRVSISACIIRRFSRLGQALSSEEGLPYNVLTSGA
jgi:hypothetical protein